MVVHNGEWTTGHAARPKKQTSLRGRYYHPGAHLALGVGFLYFGYDYIKTYDWLQKIFALLFILGFVAALVYAMKKLSTTNQP